MYTIKSLSLASAYLDGGKSVRKAISDVAGGDRDFERKLEFAAAEVARIAFNWSWCTQQDDKQERNVKYLRRAAGVIR